jgi:hypothetical protein
MPDSHDRHDAADRMTPIWCQVFGTQWQKAWTAAVVLGAKPAVVAQSTPEVPSDTNASPGLIAPSAIAPAALSPALPAITGGCVMPQR